MLNIPCCRVIKYTRFLLEKQKKTQYDCHLGLTNKKTANTCWLYDIFIYKKDRKQKIN